MSSISYGSRPSESAKLALQRPDKPYETGQPALLLVLSGTLPVTFRGTTYRFPLSVWVPHAYPREAPMVYVVPTEEIVIRPGQHVGGDGKCYHPYLAGWAEFWSRSTILDLLAILRDVFAKEPPVVSKQQQLRPPRQEVLSPPPVPPLPQEFVSSPPPRPPESVAGPVPPRPPPLLERPNIQRGQEGLSPPTSNPGPARGAVPPPVPNRENSHRYVDPGAAYQTGYAHQPKPLPARSSSLQNFEGPPLPTSFNSQQTPYYNPYGSPESQWSQPFSIAQQQASALYGGSSAVHLSAPGGLNMGYQQPPVPMPQTQLPSAQQRLSRPKPAPPVEDLLSSDLSLPLPRQDPASTAPPPPIPPNPEKDYLLHQIALQLRTLRQQSLEQTNSSLPALRTQHIALTNAHHALLGELNELKSLDAALASNERILQDSMRKADEVITSAAGREVPGVDEVLVAPTVVGGQLYELICEERAVGDAMFVLGRALERERIGVEVFLKQTRSLAREQFLKKALIKKIARGMGLIEDIPRR
ncbi:hypothetical protein FGG08_000768 [Glutinoglossum americanum]|uniref:ESCRT-I complex subunit TSG101 n=1 Tax=Glutinoglossum americanum TaxID=1670608 RepID=A0A9P8L3H2_9PEZI|nr:hypothetical protein FGG08_000768 [Glutinoglossum americanum]